MVFQRVPGSNSQRTNRIHLRLLRSLSSASYYCSHPCPEFPPHTFFRRFIPSTLSSKQHNISHRRVLYKCPRRETWSERAERDKIREEFAKSYPPLERLNWMPFEPWADHLIWDSAAEKLYVLSRLQY
ncbi:unnamed protein product [Penicillium salamii]|uniref:Uncharacterized protein n=1 Tax=Penicillium salamii TaxID=1612424 RepID=A0A9W4JI91_9EURO|nr:unnamed protein product [Penicillium salamii]CAG8104267.1 unnamed protein product [Penicillium salamii]CAG8143981.1 unnamed protein product [Penicillium salamii]CAG8179249.1 unnamed protein product [Penicillium salamii]CAG8237501.1 unnamed protein product [Penicillium salamii]